MRTSVTEWRGRHGWMVLVCCWVLSFKAFGGQCTASANGDWASSSTWSCGRAPQAGDTLTIPAGRTVSVTTNITYSGAIMRIRVLGTLSFIGGGSKLTFPCGTIFEILPPSGLVTGNSSANSQTIRICSVTVWSVGSNNNATGYTAWPSGSTLPVELVYFNGTANGQEVGLTWATATESNSATFELLRGTDPVELEPLTSLSAAGNSVTFRSYAYTDRTVTDGTWYYRLLQTDTDGTVNDLGLVAVQVKGGQVFQCFPVPVSDRLEVVAPEGAGRLIVCSMEGRPLIDLPMTGQRTSLDVGHLPNGTYVVRLVNGDQVRSQRVVVAH